MGERDSPTAFTTVVAARAVDKPARRDGKKAVSTSRPERRARAAKPRLETMVKASQTGYATADALQTFLKTTPREVRQASTGGSGAKARRNGQMVDCYVMAAGDEVVINPGF